MHPGMDFLALHSKLTFHFPTFAAAFFTLASPTSRAVQLSEPAKGNNHLWHESRSISIQASKSVAYNPHWNHVLKQNLDLYNQRNDRDSSHVGIWKAALRLRVLKLNDLGTTWGTTMVEDNSCTVLFPNALICFDLRQPIQTMKKTQKCWFSSSSKHNWIPKPMFDTLGTVSQTPCQPCQDFSMAFYEKCGGPEMPKYFKSEICLYLHLERKIHLSSGPHGWKLVVNFWCWDSTRTTTSPKRRPE